MLHLSHICLIMLKKRNATKQSRLNHSTDAERGKTKRVKPVLRGRRESGCRALGNMQLVEGAGKKRNRCQERENGARREKIRNRCKKRENMELVQDAGKQLVQGARKNATGVKSEKIWNLYKTRENTQPVSRAGKHGTSARRAKTYNWCKARENRQPVSRAEKHGTCARSGKTYNWWCKARENTQPVSRADIAGQTWN